MTILERDNLPELLSVLQEQGYTVIGPSVRDQAICYEEIDSVADLPIGWTDEQDNGQYRLKRRDDQAVFGYVVGPMTWKKYLYPPRTKLWEAERKKGKLSIRANPDDAPAYAFLGVRSCELHGILIQDKVFLDGAYQDPVYKARREKALIIAANCTQAAKTCFCPSMDTGPKARSGYDLVMTEVCQRDRHYFVMDAGTEKGKAILQTLNQRPAGEQECRDAQQAEQNAVQQITRTLYNQGIKEVLYNNLEHPRWDQVADRCLSCANCTMVCPTCFCSTVEDVTDITGEHAERWRMWDSCFNLDFSYIHGGNVRSSTKSRYRQWVTHKLASWQDQFDVSGCVGCGRCIAWCPVGIDITEEARVIREGQAPVKASS